MVRGYVHRFRISSLFCVFVMQIQCHTVIGMDMDVVVQKSSCIAKVNNQLINLQPLDSSAAPRLTSQFTALGSTWNYTYNPCMEFNIPDNPNDGFGDKCLSVSICKYGEQVRRRYYYTLGFQQNGKFQATMGTDNNMTMSLVFEGYRSMKGKRSAVQLVCDRERSKPEDALFKVVKDERRLGDVVMELHHLCCCLDGCPITKLSQTGGITKQPHTGPNLPEHIYHSGTRNNKTVLQEGLPEQKPEESSTGKDRTKVLIIVGVNMAVILMAGVVGLLCYNKKSHLEIYHKLPGIRSQPEPTLWQLANSTDLMENGNAGPIVRAGSQPIHNSSMGNLKTGYRDGEPHIRRKSLCFPVLEHCGLPEECITMGQRLGGGIFGDTYVGQWTGIPVAVKRITLSVHKYQLSQEFIRNMQESVTYLSQQRHRNIVSVLGYCSESKHPYIISEFITGQVVKDFIKHASQNLTWPHRVKILSQVADGMAFLHSTNPPILHRDLRCSNMFLTNNDVVKVCDFGIVKLTQSLRSDCQQEDCACQGLYSACPPSISWTAPEVLAHPNSLESDGHITTASDVYSYSIVMWELINGNDPYEEMHTAPEVIEHVLSGGRPEITAYAKVLPMYVAHMKQCWNANPTERHSFRQISVHLKEILHQAKLFQKALNTKGARPKTRTLTFSDEIKVKGSPRPARVKSKEITPEDSKAQNT